MKPRSQYFWPTIVACIILLPGVGATLTSGPAMPEYNDFEPVDATDLVNLPTGDFSYNIPVMTVPGPGLDFPLVLNYHSGILVKQEASWVGLGWNLQAGSITRQVNKVPDDFSGEVIREEIKSNVIHGWMASVSCNAATVGVSWDNTNGYGGMVGLTLAPKGSPLSLDVSMGTNGVYEGTSISLGLSAGGGKVIGLGAQLSIGVSTSSGLTAGLGAGVSMINANAMNGAKSGSLASAGISLSQRGGLGAGARLGLSQSNTSSISGQMHSSSSGMSIPIVTPIGFFTVSWGNWANWIDGVEENRHFGFLYADSKGMDCITTAGAVDCSNWSKNEPIPNPDNPSEPLGTWKIYKKHEVSQAAESTTSGARLMATSEDIYMVATQGVSGAFKPFRKEDGDYAVNLDLWEKFVSEPCSDLVARFVQFLVNEDYCGNYKSVNRTKILEQGRNFLNTSGTETVPDVYWRFLDDPGGAEYTDYSTRDATALVGIRSKRIKPFFQRNKLTGFEITKEDGVTYTYGFPLLNLWEKKTGKSESGNLNIKTTQETKSNYAYAWLLTGIKNPDYVAMSTGSSCETDVVACKPKQGDLGGWIRFDYGYGGAVDKVMAYKWRTPFIRSFPEFPVTDEQMNSAGFTSSDFGGYTKEKIPFNTERSAAEGIKEVAYLMKVETPTHRADFITSDRLDGLDANHTSDKIAGDVLDLTMISESNIVEIMNIMFGGIGFRTYNADRSISYQTRLAIGTQLELAGSHERFIVVSGGSPGYVPVHRPFSVIATVEQGTNGWNKAVFNIADMAHSVTMISSSGSETTDSRQIPLDYTIRIVSQPATAMKNLQSIILTNKIFNQEVASVEFSFNYDLCKNTPNSQATPDHGKLSLEKVRIGAGAAGPWLPWYEFEYGFNPPYQTGTWAPFERSQWDRWGYHCSNCGNSPAPTQRIHEPNRNDSRAWSMTAIELPSGGKIKVDYESDRADLVGFWDPISGTQKFKSAFESFPTTGELDKILINSQDNDLMSIGMGAGIKRLQPFLHAQGVHPDMVTDYTLELHMTFESNPPHQSGAFGYEILAIDNTDFENCVIEPSFFPSLLSDGTDFFDHHKHYYLLNRWDPQGNPVGIVNLGLRIRKSNSCKDFEIRYGIAHDLAGTGNSAVTGWTSRNMLMDVKVVANMASGAVVNLGNGGGVRVRELIFEEPFARATPVQNRVTYGYVQGVTPTMPPTLADYVDVNYPDNQGFEFHVGGPGITYRKVSALYVEQGYHTDYHFLTPFDLPTKIIPSGGVTQVDYRVEVKDFSALWGALWKKEDFKQGSSSPVRTENKVWAYNASFNGGAILKATMADGPDEPVEENIGVDYPREGVYPYVFFPFPGSSFPLPGGSTAEGRRYFGLHQTLSSLRYFAADCALSADDATELTNCSETNRKTTQTIYKRFLPHVFESSVKQDGLAGSSLQYFNDFITGNPLKTRKENSDGTILVTKTLPAYNYYLPMLYKHQYTQTRGEITYQHSSNVVDMRSDDLPANAVAAKLDFWRPVGADISTVPVLGDVFTTFQAFRLFSTLRWNNTRNSTMTTPMDVCRHPTIAGVPLTNLYRCDDPTPAELIGWESEGRKVGYDEFGNLTEFHDVFGVPTSQVFGYGKSYPTAFAQNANLKDIFYESFETNTDVTSQLQLREGGDPEHPEQLYNFELSGKIWKSGKQSLSVLNLGTKEVCFDLPTLNQGKTYSASVWYYDVTDGGTPLDFGGTRPGLFIGEKDVCQVQVFPNGINGQLPPASGQPGYEFRATGSRKWKRIQLKFSPCSEIDLEKVEVCLSASKGNTGIPVLYDELRVFPVDAFMTTYAYNPMGKMTSMLDVNEIGAHFEYDLFGNLIGIKNDDGALLTEQAKSFGKR